MSHELVEELQRTEVINAISAAIDAIEAALEHEDFKQRTVRVAANKMRQAMGLATLANAKFHDSVRKGRGQ